MKRLGRWLKRIGIGLLILAVLLAIPVLPRITMPRFPSPPGADSIELAINPGYQVNSFAQMLLGSQYRELWKQPIKVEVLDLRAFDGGLRPTREGGGQETRSLHFESDSGHHFIFRSVDKEVLRLLNAGLARSPVAWLVHDQTSSSFPAGALVATPIQQAVGLASAQPRLVVMPDDDRLGEYRERFSGVIGLLQLGPEHYVKALPGTEEVTEVKDTEEVLPLADSSSRHRLDTHSYLTARILDAFLNDWDRHPGQWRWAPLGEDYGIRWLAIPVDRDQVFSSYDGPIMLIARLRTTKLAVFGPELPSVRGLMYNSRTLDRRLLAGFERNVWDSTAAYVMGRLTDSLIEAAVKELPEPYYRLSGPWLATVLKQRRAQLPAHARLFYSRLADRSEVHGTAESETLFVTYHSDGSVEVRLAAAIDSAGPAFFARRYQPAETRQVDIYLAGGKDSVAVRGTPPGGIAVRAYDEKRRRISLDPAARTARP